MSMFSFNSDPVVVPTDTTEEEIVEIDYSEIAEDEYASGDEPDFGDDL